MFRRSLLTELGGFDEALVFGEDLDFYFRLLELDVRLIIETEPAIYHRRHAGNMTNDRKAMHQALLRAHYNSIVRRRKLGRTRPLDVFFFKQFDSEVEFGGPPKEQASAVVGAGQADPARQDNRTAVLASAASYCVVIPAYNAAITLLEALQSTARQTRQPERVIVVDDGSTDETASIAESWGATVIRQENQGPGAATNAAVAIVDTPLIAFLDADDIWLDTKSEIQLAILDAERSVAAVFGKLQHFRHGQSHGGMQTIRDGWGRTTMMIRTDAMRAIGPIYDPPYGGRGEMIDWIARGREAGHVFKMMSEVVGLRRIMPGSMSSGWGDQDRGYLDIVRRALERKRMTESK
jgi:hypothetical protein